MQHVRLGLLSFLCAAAGAALLAQAPPHPASRNPHLGNREAVRSGMALYRVRCADCHGLDATGYRGPDLTATLAGGMTDERLFDVIRRGVPGTDMPPQGNGVSDDDVLLLIAFLRNLSGAGSAAERPVGNMENGSRISVMPGSGSLDDGVAEHPAPLIPAAIPQRSEVRRPRNRKSMPLRCPGGAGYSTPSAARPTPRAGYIVSAPVRIRYASFPRCS